MSSFAQGTHERPASALTSQGSRGRRLSLPPEGWSSTISRGIRAISRGPSPFRSRDRSERQEDLGEDTTANPNPIPQRMPSTQKSDLEVALELAREMSLLEYEDINSLHPLVVAQLATVAGERLPVFDEPLSYPNHQSVAGDVNNHLTVPAHGPAEPHRRHRSSSVSKILILCDDCRENKVDVYYCNVCNEKFCTECWDRARPHRNNIPTADGTPHEKTNHVVAEKIKTCLKPELGEDQTKLHHDDEPTAWFGITKDQMDTLIFEDYGRYASILAMGTARQKESQKESRYPGLVSFVGQTGAGKSTLIKVLIELQTQHQRHFESPVVGSVSTNVPTSGDVHMYSDPLTFGKKHPILYADCEGLQGGEREPLGAKSRSKDKHGDQKRTPSFQKRLRMLHHGSKREVVWANTAERRTREFAVTNLYPRLLFTFSDVIVFVSKNARVIENTMERLVQWAAAALETSSNQPVLPHLIIALNASENTVDAEQWDVDVATRLHTDIPIDVVNKNANLRPFVKFWEDRGHPITSAMDLLRTYYANVRVVRIPTGARPKLISEQTIKLYDEIKKACDTSRDQKRKWRMLLSADELQPYLQYAFDHFSNNLDAPFDFVKASLTQNSIPNDFGGSILKMAINIMQVWENKLDAEHIFNELSPLVASCIMLDSTRNKIPGGADTIFPKHYKELCDDALEEFCNKYWPCEYVSPVGRCVNVRNFHDCKGKRSVFSICTSDWVSAIYCLTSVPDLCATIVLVAISCV